MNSFSILLGSETFFGTLTTIVVLCILMNDNNFIYKICQDIKDHTWVLFEKNSDSIKSELTDNEVKVKGKIRLYNDAIRANGKEILYNEGVELLDNIHLKSVSTGKDIMLLSSKIQNAFDFVISSKEFVIAPQYCFAFCIIIFLLNDFNIQFGECGYISTVAFFITLLSYILWGNIWYMYLIKAKIGNMPNENSLHNHSKLKIKRFWNGLLFNFISCLVIVALFWLISLLFNWSESGYALMVYTLPFGMLFMYQFNHH